MELRIKADKAIARAKLLDDAAWRKENKIAVKLAIAKNKADKARAKDQATVRKSERRVIIISIMRHTERTSVESERQALYRKRVMMSHEREAGNVALAQARLIANEYGS